MVMAMEGVEGRRRWREVDDTLNSLEPRSAIDCNNPKLSRKARKMFCESEEVTTVRTRRNTTAEEVVPGTTSRPPARTLSPAFPPTTASSWSHPGLQTVTVPVTTTQDWLNSLPECQDLVPGLDDMDQDCQNSTMPPPIVRYRDMVFERLIHQSWEDTQSKINMERKMYGIDLEPLNVDQLAGTTGALLEVSETAGLYSADLRMWDVKVHGLSDIYLSEVEVTRDKTLSDLKMMTQFRWLLTTQVT